MDWSKVRMIFIREARDQLRDRRTLFMIAVLPIMLYPLMGMSMLQVYTFVRQHATRVLLIGEDELPASPKLIDGNHFARDLFPDEASQQLLEVESRPQDSSLDEARTGELATRELQNGFEAVIVFPSDFSERLEEFRRLISERSSTSEVGEAESVSVPSPRIFYNAAKEKSQITNARLLQALSRWTDAIGRQNLASQNLPVTTMRPFEVSEQDIATKGNRAAATWARILPFMLLIWALTGAFYPAIDLCAGEKERGTLETLLISPAERGEIVCGKLFTVMAFSIITSALNLASIGVTGSLLFRQVEGFSAPPIAAIGWLMLALIPMGALFSALCLALAAFARSTKEGQYYLMPLLLVTMPLLILPMTPSVELNLGNSLIPVTGVVLILRALLQGGYSEALWYAVPVIAVTLVCCVFALRWAIDQFNKESVLFRESERLDLGLWFRRLFSDREDTPSPAEAFFCCMLVLLIGFFLRMAASAADMAAPGGFIRTALVSQLVVILTPAMLLTIMLTRSPRKTLQLLRPRRLITLPAAIVLAIVAHPLAFGLNSVVQKLYPINSDIARAFQDAIGNVTLGWPLLLTLAVVPAICEELCFRGFVLSGFRRSGHKWRAIALSSFFFGVTHQIFQQSIIAATIGLAIGYIAIQSGSIFPGMLFHCVHNALGVLAAKSPMTAESARAWSFFVEYTSEGPAYTLPAIAASGIATAALLYWFHTLPYRKTEEEIVQSAIERGEALEPVAP